MTAPILASAEFVADTRTPSAELRAAVTALYPRPVRRIDRFIQLALVGAGRCCSGKPGERSGLYLASPNGSVGSNSSMLDATHEQKLAPGPITFINSVSNAAGFHVAQNLGLDGRNIFVAADGRSSGLIKVFRLAALDLARGDVDQALVGFVHECLDPDAAVNTEGSHWFLLGGGGETALADATFVGGGPGDPGHVATDPSDVEPLDRGDGSGYVFEHVSRLSRWLVAEGEARPSAWIGHESAPATRGMLLRRRPHRARTA